MRVQAPGASACIFAVMVREGCGSEKGSACGGGCAAAAAAQADAVVAALQAAVPVFSTDGRTVDDLVADGLRVTGRTVAVAESCTGGLLGARLSRRPGASDYFLGGVVSYADQVKMDLLDVPPGLLAQRHLVERGIGHFRGLGGL